MRRVGGWIALAVIAWSVTAGAQAVDPAAAELLFSEGRKAMERQDYAAACSKFAESQRLDPAAGTLINLAECLDRQGKLAKSWQTWKEALRMLRAGDDRRWAVEHRIESVEERLPRLEIRLTEDAPTDSVILRDEVELRRASLALPLPVDPGEHRIEVTAPGHEPRIYTLDLAEGDRERLVVEPGPPREAPAPEPTDEAPPPEKAPTTPAGVRPSRGQSAKGGGGAARTAGIVTLSAGATSLVVGGVFGGLAIGKKSTMDSHCQRLGSDLRCDPAGLDASSTGQAFATVANVAIAVGVLGAGVGTYLLVRSSQSEERGARVTRISTRARPGGGSVSLSTTF